MKRIRPRKPMGRRYQQDQELLTRDLVKKAEAARKAPKKRFKKQGPLPLHSRTPPTVKKAIKKAKEKRKVVSPHIDRIVQAEVNRNDRKPAPKVSPHAGGDISNSALRRAIKNANAHVESRMPPAAKKRKRPAERAKKPPLRKVGACDLIDEALAEIEALAGEMREWADNMEDKLSHTPKYDTVSSSADTLENIQNPTDGLDAALRARLNKIMIDYQDPTPRRRGYSRADRSDQCIHQLEAACDAFENPDLEWEKNTDADDAADLKAECDEIVSELMGVEFPGMYG